MYDARQARAGCQHRARAATTGRRRAADPATRAARAVRGQGQRAPIASTIASASGRSTSAPNAAGSPFASWARAAARSRSGSRRGRARTPGRREGRQPGHLPGTDDEDAPSGERPDRVPDPVECDVGERPRLPVAPGAGLAAEMERDLEQPLEDRVQRRGAGRVRSDVLGTRLGCRQPAVCEALPELVEDLVLADDDAVQPRGDREQVTGRGHALEAPDAVGERGTASGAPLAWSSTMYSSTR